MVGFQEAVEIAEKYYTEKGVRDVKIGTVYETEEKWILFYDLGYIMQIGSVVVLVNKKNGEVETKGYPSREMHKVLNTAHKVQ